MAVDVRDVATGTLCGNLEALADVLGGDTVGPALREAARRLRGNVALGVSGHPRRDRKEHDNTY